MFREIRREKNELNVEDVKQLLKTAKRGVLAINSEDGYPYGLPINYFYDEENKKIYFHSSKVGYKVELLKKSDKVSFTIFGEEIFKEESWAPYVRSVIVFGKCHPINDNNEALKAIYKFALKYYPNKEMVDEEVNQDFKAVQMYEIEIEHVSGKQVHEK